MIYNCKNCGNPIFNESEMGTEENGTLSSEFCINCYKNGRFSDNDTNSDTEFYRALTPSSDGGLLNLSEGSSDINTEFIDFTIKD